MKKMKWPQAALALLGFFLLLGVLFAAGGIIASLLGIQGLLSHIMSGLLGIIILAATANIVRRFHKDEEFDKKLIHERILMHERVLDAMAKISQGNFDVFVEPDQRHPEFASALNKMAQDLGSLENLRQDFISNVSHEFQSPLTSIQGFAALLKTCDEKDKLHYIGIIENESKRLSSLSNNLLKLSNLENAELEHKDFRLDKQIQQIILTAEPQWSKKNINIDVNLEKNTYDGDDELLAQVWINLLHNAIKFTPEGGDIKLTLKDNIFTIEDNGAGITPKDQMHIFERFYKADKARDRSLGGNGLGLALAKKIVELHGGSITLNSEPGRGAVFTVALPINICGGA